MIDVATTAFKHGKVLFVGVLVVVVAGFVPSFFPAWSGREVDFSTYHHVHGIIMLLWLALLITQPILIQSGQFNLHRMLGLCSPALLIAVLFSVLLLAHSQLEIENERAGFQLYIPLKDLLVIVTLYTMGIWFRKSPAVHSRLMAGTAFQLLEPALTRAFSLVMAAPASYLATLLVIDLAIVALIYMDRGLDRGKWVFYFVLGLTLSIQGFLVTGGPNSDWFMAFTKWFAALPIT